MQKFDKGLRCRCRKSNTYVLLLLSRRDNIKGTTTVDSEKKILKSMVIVELASYAGAATEKFKVPQYPKLLYMAIH